MPVIPFGTDNIMHVTSSLLDPVPIFPGDLLHSSFSNRMVAALKHLTDKNLTIAMCQRKGDVW